MSTSEPSPFNSTTPSSDITSVLEQEVKQLKEQQLANEAMFKELNQQRLRQLEEEENKKIKEETRKEYTIKDKSVQEFLSGFSETILGIINDTLYKIGHPQDESFGWTDIINTGDRLLYLGLLIVIISLFLAIFNCV